MGDNNNQSGSQMTLRPKSNIAAPEEPEIKDSVSPSANSPRKESDQSVSARKSLRPAGQSSRTARTPQANKFQPPDEQQLITPSKDSKAGEKGGYERNTAKAKKQSQDTLEKIALAKAELDASTLGSTPINTPRRPGPGNTW